MSETPTRPDELRTLEEKRRATGLSPVEEARRTELASAPPAPLPRGFDVHAAAASVRAAVAAEPARVEATAAWDLGEPAAVVRQAPPSHGDAGPAVGCPEAASAEDAPAEPMTVDADDIVADLAPEPPAPLEGPAAPPAAELVRPAPAVDEDPAAEPAPGPAPLAEVAPSGAGVPDEALELAPPLLVAAAPEPSGPTGPARELGEPVDLVTLLAEPALAPGSVTASDAADEPPNLAPEPPHGRGGEAPPAPPAWLPGTVATELEPTFGDDLAVLQPTNSPGAVAKELEATPGPHREAAELEPIFQLDSTATELDPAEPVGAAAEREPVYPRHPEAAELEPLFLDEPRVAPPPSALGEPGPARGGKLRVVLHTADGRVRRGLIAGFTPDAPELHVEGADGTTAAIATDDVHAIFFMLGAGEPAPSVAGARVVVTFRDGRRVAGVSTDYRPESAGFAVVPSDPRTRTARVWIYRRAVRRVEVTAPGV